MNKIIMMIIVLMIFSVNLSANKDPEIAKGMILYENGKYEEAIEHFEKLEEKKKDSSVLHLWIAKSYMANINNVSFFTKAMYSSSIQDNLKLSIEKDPKNVEARIFLAQYKFNAPSIGGGDKDEAWEQTDEILKLSPVKGHELKGQFYSQEKNYDKAVIEYDEILKLEPENSHVYYLKGIMYQQAEIYEKALNSFESALKIDPEALESLYQIGRNAVFSKTGLDRGIEALNEYLKHDPDKSLPQHDSAYWRLAMIYNLKNDIDRAKEFINKAIAIDPENDDYKKLLKELN